MFGQFRWDYCMPEVSMTAQRRMIHCVTSFLMLFTLVIFMMVTTRRFAIHGSPNASTLQRIVAAVSPVIDGNAAPTLMRGDDGRSALSPLIGHKLNHWLRSVNHQGPWLLMFPASYQLNKTSVRRSADFNQRGVGPGNPRPLRLLDESWKESRLKEISAKLNEDHMWPNYQLVDYHEATRYMSILNCDRMVVYSVHPMMAKNVTKELIRHAFEWDSGASAPSSFPTQCIVNAFPYEMSSRPEVDRYSAVLRIMHLFTSTTLSRSDAETTVPWIFSVSPHTTFTNRLSINQVLIDVEQVAGAPPADSRRLSENSNNWLDKLLSWIASPGSSEEGEIDGKPVSSDMSIDPNNLPWHDEPNTNTIESLMCQSPNPPISCNFNLDTPSMQQMAFIAGSKTRCHSKFASLIGSDIQVYRPSTLAALIAGTMIDIHHHARKPINEAATLSRILLTLGGIKHSDMERVCQAKLDGSAGRRRWYDACRAKKRMVSARTVDPRRFSGSLASRPLYDESIVDQHVFIHNKENELSTIGDVVWEAVRREANVWLSASSESAFRFFDGAVPSGDWTLEGPNAIAVVCGRWLSGSGCVKDLSEHGVVSENAAWTCGDMAVSFNGCKYTDYYSKIFRSQIVSPLCHSSLPWLRNNDGTEFTLKRFADDIEDEYVEEEIIIDELQTTST